VRLGAALLLCASCGGGPRLTNLRCRDPQRCQHAEDPVRLLLQVDFDDESGTMSAGTLRLRLNGGDQGTLSLSNLFVSQQIASGATQGTLLFDDELHLDTIEQDQHLEVNVQAVNGHGEGSNDPGLDLLVHLGGSGLGPEPGGGRNARSIGGGP